MSPTAIQEPQAEGSRNISSFYVPWAHQVNFHTSPAKFRLQVGGFGSGKSRPLLMEAIFHALEYPGSNSLILRKTIPDLKRTVIDKFLSDVPRWLYDFYNQSDHIVYFHPQPELDAKGKPTGKMLQSKLFFGACEREADVGKYLSTEYVFIGFEELGEFSFAIWDALAGRNRCPLPGARACMAAATNPMGIGWSWIKKLWVDHKPFQGMDPEKYEASDYEYFHSTVDQNPIYAQDKEYIGTLERSPLRDKIRWGRLDSVTGQFFDNWEPKRHVRPMSDFLFEDWQPVWVGYDYGFGHWATQIFMTKALLKPRWDGEKPKMVNVVIKELYMQEKTPEEQTNALIMSIPRVTKKNIAAGQEFWDDPPETEESQYGYRWKIDSIHFSWERFNRTTSNRTVADEVGDILSMAGLPRPTRSNTDRVAGWQKIYSLLDSDDLFVLDTCTELAEAIPLLVRSNVNLEDVEKPKGVSLSDDLGDGFRYAVAGVLLDPEDKPDHIKKREKYAAIKDPMARSVAMYTDWNKEQAKQRKPERPINVPSWYRKVKPDA
jgi:phage terminase large subunit